MELKEYCLGGSSASRMQYNAINLPFYNIASLLFTVSIDYPIFYRYLFIISQPWLALCCRCLASPYYMSLPGNDHRQYSTAHDGTNQELGFGIIEHLVHFTSDWRKVGGGLNVSTFFKN